MSIDLNKYEPKDLIKLIRKQKGLKQDEFAKLIGKTIHWVRNNEEGKTRFYFEDFLKIIDKCGYDIEINKKA